MTSSRAHSEQPCTFVTEVPDLEDLNRYQLGENIYKVLREKKWKQKDLAWELAITRQLLSKYINGDVIPSYMVLYRISRALDVTMDFLVEGIEK